MPIRRVWFGIMMRRLRGYLGFAIVLGCLTAVPAVARPADDSRAKGLESAALGDAGAAYDLLAPWVEGHPDDVEAKAALAVVAAQTGRLDEAETLFVSLPAGDARLALLGADLALARGEWRVAIARLEPHRKQHPPAVDREFKRILGQAYVEIGEPELALEALGSVSGDPGLTLSRGRALFQSGLMEDAVEELKPFAEQIRRMGVENAPPSQRQLMVDLLVDYARALLAAGEASEAVAVLEPNVVGLQNRRAWKLLAQALVAAGRGDEARAVLNRGATLTKAKSGPGDEGK